MSRTKNWNDSLRSVSSTTASIISRFTYRPKGHDLEDNDDDDSVFSDTDSLNTISSIVYGKEKAEKRHQTVYSVDEADWAPDGYVKHSALAIGELSFKQQIKLRWRHTMKWSNMIRCGMILFCLAYFVFNSITILLDYWRHDSLIYLQYNRPDKTTPPGITICTHCVLCKNSTIGKVETRHLFRDYLLYRYINPSDDIKKLQYRDIKFKCTVRPNNHDYRDNRTIDCEDAANVMLSMQEGHKCYTFFSNLFGQLSTADPKDVPKIDYDLTTTIDIKITGNFLANPNSDTYSRPGMRRPQLTNRTTGLFITVHDPEILPDMNEASFHKLLLGRTHHLLFSKLTQKLLPHPFPSRCHNYAKTREESSMLEERIYSRGLMLTQEGLNIYRSKGECLLFCLWRMLNADRCTNFFSIFTEEMVSREETFQTYKILRHLMSRNPGRRVKSNETMATAIKYKNKMCPITNRALNNYIAVKYNCDKVCRPSCSIDTFSAEQYFDESTTGPSASKQTSIKIYWAQQMRTEIYHQPKMDLQDFLGNLGGHAHVAIGISLLHVLNFLIDFIRYSDFRAPNRDCCSRLHWLMDCFAIRKHSSAFG